MPRADDQDTLLPCPACDDGVRVIVNAGTYRMRRCAWCRGTRTVAAGTLKKYRRWVRIRARNRCDKVQ